MIYEYVCNNEKCADYKALKEIRKPLADYDIKEICKSCKTILDRNYNIPAIKTSDNYKG